MELTFHLCQISSDHIRVGGLSIQVYWSICPFFGPMPHFYKIAITWQEVLKSRNDVEPSNFILMLVNEKIWAKWECMRKMGKREKAGPICKHSNLIFKTLCRPTIHICRLTSIWRLPVCLEGEGFLVGLWSANSQRGLSSQQPVPDLSSICQFIQNKKELCGIERARGPSLVRSQHSAKQPWRMKSGFPTARAHHLTLEISPCLLMVEIPTIEEKDFKFTFRDTNKI